MNWINSCKLKTKKECKNRFCLIKKEKKNLNLENNNFKHLKNKNNKKKIGEYKRK